MSLDMFFQHFFNALTLGSLYGLIAIGYTMVYGILRLINFAHGDILMLDVYKRQPCSAASAFLPKRASAAGRASL